MISQRGPDIDRLRSSRASLQASIENKRIFITVAKQVENAI